MFRPFQVWPSLGSIQLSEKLYNLIEGDSVARGPKLLSIRNYVIEIMTRK